MTIRTRFAPSPTGFLHIGGARTALYNWLFAKKNNGKFLLRVEDTDMERSTDDSISQILASMKWLGLEPDEKPVFQSERIDIYNKYIDLLIDNGNAYQCFCSKEELEVSRNEQKKKNLKPRYDGRCREANKKLRIDEPYVIRFKNPQIGDINFIDSIRGKVKFNNSELDDLVIQRSDRTPTYNFAVVIDDNDMRITHVIRGDDHINNTPRQINIMKALKFDIPSYAHLPMILGQDGARLSKRHGAEGVIDYRDGGFLSDALINYLVRLGWSHGDQEIFSKDELISLFSLEKIHQSPASFDQKKLLWVNQQWLKNISLNDIIPLLTPFLINIGMKPDNKDLILSIADVMKGRSSTLEEVSKKSEFIFSRPSFYDEDAQKTFFGEDILDIFSNIENSLSALKEWSNESIQESVKSVANVMNHKLIAVAQPIRIAMTGNIFSPGIGETLYLLGKKETIVRIRNINMYIREKNSFYE
tara:strand:+ start:693 stop:2111 length:1419 start_codon:yes stop_codon:yes gene_type:complete